MYKQSKILLSVILLFGIFLVGCEKLPSVVPGANEPLINEISLQSTLQPVVEVPEDETPEDTEVVKDSVKFTDIDYSSAGGSFSFRGVLQFSDVPIEQLTVKLFCNKLEKASVLSDMTGKFNIVSTCAPNQEAYAQVEYNSIPIESTHVIVPHGRFGHRTLSVTSSPAGVPEFSTLTIGVAVVTVLFGLIFLRKR